VPLPPLLLLLNLLPLLTELPLPLLRLDNVAVPPATSPLKTKPVRVEGHSDRN